MFLSGAIKEVKRFVKIRLKKDKTANKAIGIKEIEDYLNKKKI